MSDPYKYFRIEAKELSEQLSAATLALEKQTPGAIAKLLRLAHTLKGAARVVKQAAIADAAHAIEDALDGQREQTSVARGVIDRVLQRIEDIGRHLATLAPSAPQAPLTPVPEALHADVSSVDALLESMAEAHVQLGSVRRALAPLDRAATLAASSALDHLDRELWQARETAEQLRLLPASTLFTPLERIAQDTALALGKTVAVQTSGGQVRLDAHILVTVRTALVQLMRNAVAHGIELPAERHAARKPAAGQVSVAVMRRGRRVVFSVSDDGRGIDHNAVLRAAKERGVPTGGDLLSLLLSGGVSTAAFVSEVSGRGVGLDVVREAMEQSAGDIALDTEPGRGSRFELSVPLSLAAIYGVTLQGGDVTATVALDAVVRTLRLGPTDVSQTGDRAAIAFEGQLIPFISLARALGADQPQRTRCSAVVVRSSQGLAALGIDRVRGAANIVFQPLPPLALAADIVAGASLDADGNPQWVLDADGIVAAAQRGAPARVAGRPPLPVLVVDDSLTTRMLELSILDSAGYATDSAASAEEALQKMHAARFGLVLVDVEMPGMDGFAFVERLRADPALHDVPAILVTSRGAGEDRRRGELAGAQGYIVKSEFDQSDLLARIKHLVRA